jgi:outer membrane protein assembly factor BamB
VFTLDGELLQTIAMGSTGWKRYTGARSTPLKYGSLVLGQMPSSQIYAVDLETEEARWSVNAWKDFGSGKGSLGWGVAESPVRHKDFYVFSPCSRDSKTPGIVALDARTGKAAWELPGRANEGERYSAGNSGSGLFRHNGRATIAHQTWYYLVCIDADTGKLLWEIPTGKGDGGMTPVYGEGFLFNSAAGRMMMLKLNADGSDYEPLWTAFDCDRAYSHAVISGGRLYLFGLDTFAAESGKQSKDEFLDRVKGGARGGVAKATGLLCLDAATGAKLAFQPTPTPCEQAGHWWAADGMLYAWWLTKEGEGSLKPTLALIRPTATGLDVVSSFVLTPDKESAGVSELNWQINTCPAISDGRLFLRYGSLYVYDLRTEQPAYGWRGDGAGRTENAIPPVRWSRHDNLAWSCALPGRALSAAAVRNGAAWVMTEAGLACVREGRVAWTAALKPAGGGAPEPTPVARENRVYAATGSGTLACFEADGKEVWKVSVTPGDAARPMGSPVLCGDLLVIQGRDLEARRVSDGSPAWRVAAPVGAVAHTPARVRLNDGVVLFTAWGAAIRVSDGKVLGGGLPTLADASPVAADGAVLYCGAKTAGRPAAAAVYRLPASAGDALKVQPAWERQLDFAADGAALADGDLFYVLDAVHVLHVLDAATGATVYRQSLIPESEKPGALRAGGDLMKAGGMLYAVNLGARGRTVVFEPGRVFRKVWEYGVKDPAPANPAFEMERQYVCRGNVLHAIAGKTPCEPVALEVRQLPPAAAPAQMTDLPVSALQADVTPTNWVAIGPFSPRSVEKDFLAELGGRSNSLLRTGTEVVRGGKTHQARPLTTNDWYCGGHFTAGMNAIDVSAVVKREWNRTAYLFTAVDVDAERALEFRLLTPGGVLWNTKERLEARAWLAGRPVRDGAVFEVSKGRYPLLLQVGVGTCDEWGKIWMAPRFADVTERVAEQRRRHAAAAARWPRYVEELKGLFVLGE